METKVMFYRGDDLLLVSQGREAGFEYAARVTKTKPLTVQVTSILDESGLAKLQKAENLLVAYATKGYAYKAKVAQIEGDSVVLSLIERHEGRDFFRVDTVITTSYEVVREMPRAGGKTDKPNGPKTVDDLDLDDSVSQGERRIAALMLNLYHEVKMLREQVVERNKIDTRQLAPKLVSLSASGVRFATPYEHQRGDVLRLTMVLEDPNKPININVTVVRSDRDFFGGSGAFSTACQFKDLSSSDRERLVRYVFRSQRQALVRR